ncbi:AI-2E family transporter [Synechococcus sp. M16CYN]
MSQWLFLTALVAATTLLWSLREVLLLLFAGIILAMALCTLVGILRELLPIRRPLAVLVCLSGLLALFTTMLTVVIPPFLEEFALLLQQLPKAARTLLGLAFDWINGISRTIYGSNFPSSFQEFGFSNPGNLVPDGQSLAVGLGSGLLGLLGLAGNLSSGLVRLLFVLAVALMISAQPQGYRSVSLQLIPSFYRRRASKVLDLCGDALSSWMVGILISSLAVSALCGMALSMLGVKLVLANALLAGLLNVIPNVGPTMSTMFPMAVALLDAPWKSAAVLGVYVVIQNLESYIITPSVMQYQVELLPGLTLTAQFVFTLMFGPLGLLLTLPLAVVLQVIIREVLIHDVLDHWERVEAKL